MNIKTCSDVLETSAECNGQVSIFFHKIDTNKDGFITFHQFLALVGKFKKVFEPLFKFRDELYDIFLSKKTVLKILNRKYNLDDILAYKATHNNQLHPLPCCERFQLLLTGESHPDCFDYFDEYKIDKTSIVGTYAATLVGNSTNGNVNTTPSPVNKMMFNVLSEVDEEPISKDQSNNNNNPKHKINTIMPDAETSSTKKSTNNNNDINPNITPNSTPTVSPNLTPNNNNNNLLPDTTSKTSTTTPSSIDNNTLKVNSNSNNNNNNPESINTISTNTTNNVLPISSSNHYAGNLTLNLTGFSLSPTSTLRGKSLISSPMYQNCELSLETLIRQLVRRRTPCKYLPSKVAFNVQALGRICKKDDEIEMYYINCFPRNNRYIPTNINESASFMSQNGYLEHFGSSKLKLSMPSSNNMNVLLSPKGDMISDRELTRKVSCDSTRNMKLSLSPPQSILRRNRNPALSVDTGPYKVSLAKNIANTPHGTSALKKVVFCEDNQEFAQSSE